jgi:hypothetical protein
MKNLHYALFDLTARHELMRSLAQSLKLDIAFSCVCTVLFGASLYVVYHEPNLPAFGNDSIQKTSTGTDQVSALRIGLNGAAIAWFSGSHPITVNEFEQLRTAAAKYRHVNNAVDDGYMQIGQDFQKREWRFMNAWPKAPVSDFMHSPRIVYSKNTKGILELTELEYTVLPAEQQLDDITHITVIRNCYHPAGSRLIVN